MSPNGFPELDWQRWHAEIEQDSRDGKLAFLIAQFTQARADNTLKELWSSHPVHPF